MADDIAAHGLLQNLVAYEDEGLFYVFAGGRRYRGLKDLAKRKRIKNSDPFPVEVRPKVEAIELSLADNFTPAAMPPPDRPDKTRVRTERVRPSRNTVYA